MNKEKTVSVVVPVYNAGKNLLLLHKQLNEILSDKFMSAEIIYVDDHSNDDSWKYISELKKNDPDIRGIRLSRNFGQHNATLCGIVKATGSMIITIDDDLEASPADIPLLIEKHMETGADLVYAEFTNASPGFFRKIFTSFYKFFTRKIEGKNNGKGSSFRLISGKLAEQLKAYKNDFVFIDELCLWHTKNIEFVKTKKHPSARGRSNYSIFELSLMTGDLIMFSTVFPLRIVTFIGGVLSITNFLLGIYFIFRKVFMKVEVEGYTSLIVSILFSTGLILLALGIVAEYMSKLLKSQYGKPAYSIQEEL